MKLSSVLAVVAVALAAATPASAHPVAERVAALTGAQVRCVDGLPYMGWFNWRESDPPVIELSREKVCRPILRKWRDGWPKQTGYPYSSYGQHPLGEAIFIVAHETRHWQQWQLGGELALSEDDADDYAAREFSFWARSLGVQRYGRHLRLAELTRSYIGYKPELSGFAWSR